MKVKWPKMGLALGHFISKHRRFWGLSSFPSLTKVPLPFLPPSAHSCSFVFLSKHVGSLESRHPGRSFSCCVNSRWYLPSIPRFKLTLPSNLCLSHKVLAVSLLFYQLCFSAEFPAFWDLISPRGRAIPRTKHSPSAWFDLESSSLSIPYHISDQSQPTWRNNL